MQAVCLTQLFVGNCDIRQNLRHAAPGIARGEVIITAEDKDAPDKLSITVKQSGIFALPPEMSREDAHLETFRILFPYASATLTATTSIAGVQGIIVPRIEIDESNVYRVEFKPPRPDGDLPSAE